MKFNEECSPTNMSEKCANLTVKEVRIYDPCLNCSDPYTLKSAGIVTNKYAIFVYFVWTPIVCTIGIFGNFLSIIILKRQFKNEQMYYMQLLTMICDLIMSIFSLVYAILMPWLIIATPGPNWVKSSFGFSMSAILEVILVNIVTTTGMLIILATNLDRLQVCLL